MQNQREYRVAAITGHQLGQSFSQLIATVGVAFREALGDQRVQKNPQAPWIPTFHRAEILHGYGTAAELGKQVQFCGGEQNTTFHECAAQAKQRLAAPVNGHDRSSFGAITNGYLTSRAAHIT